MNINVSIDFNNLTDADMRDIFENIDFSSQMNAESNGENETKSNGSRSRDMDSSRDVCRGCGEYNSMVDDTVHSVRVCTKCGQVNDNLVDQNPEWRQFEDDGGKDVGRCSMPINKLLPQSSLGTTIAGNYKSRLKTLHQWSQMPYKERSLNAVFKIIHNKCQSGAILKCIEDDAKIMYKLISECKHVKGKNKGRVIIIRGKNRESLIAACVFFACRRNKKTRSQKEIADLFDLKYTEITRGCKLFIKLMKLRKLELSIGTSLPEHFVVRFCNELKIKKHYINQAMKIAKNIRKLDIASVHTPFSTATSSILLMADINGLRSISKKKLSNKFNVSEVTLTKTYKKISEYRNVLINDTLTDKLVELIKKEKEKNTIPQSVLERCKKFNVEPDVGTITNCNEDIEEAEFDDDDIDIDDLDDIDSIDKIDDDDHDKIININNDLNKYIEKINTGINNQLDETQHEYNTLINNKDI